MKRSVVRTAVVAVLLAAAFAGCIKLPSTAGNGSSGGTNDFGWKGSAGLGHDIGGKVPVTTPHLQVALGDPATSGLDKWVPPIDTALTAYDIDGDGTDELMGLANDTHVYVFNEKTGHVLATIPTTLRAGWYIERELNPVSAAVLRPGEPPSLVIADHAAYVAVWRYDPTQSTADHFEFTKVWERRLNVCNPEPSMDSQAVVADLNGDGTMEILAQTEEVGVFAFKADGATLWRQCWAGGNAAPAVSDLDGDGKMDAVFVADDGYISAIDGATGVIKWTFDAQTLGITPASVSVSPTIADIDGHLPKEVLFTARNAPEGVAYKDDHMAIVAVHADASTNWEGRALWVKTPSWANPLSYTHLVVKDVDGDGKADIFGMDWNTIGHFPGNWERLGPAHVFRLDADGNDVWVKEVDSWWSNKDIALADVDGDGQTDVLANGPYVGADGLWVYSSATGESHSFLPVGGWKILRGPQLLDLQHDGKAELVLPVEPVDPADYRGAILVIDLGLKDSAVTGAVA